MPMIDFKIREGHVLQIARHERVKGFCAVVTNNLCCIVRLDWDEVGHGHTIEEAIEQVKMKCNGQIPKPEYKIEDFQ